jgi:hypothetical protein
MAGGVLRADQMRSSTSGAGMGEGGTPGGL